MTPGLPSTNPWTPPFSDNHSLSGMPLTTTYADNFFSTQHPTTEPTPHAASRFLNIVLATSDPFTSSSTPLSRNTLTHAGNKVSRGGVSRDEAGLVWATLSGLLGLT